MDGSFNARPDDEQILPLRGEDSGEFPITPPEVEVTPEEGGDDDSNDPVVPELSAEVRSRLAQRDRLVQRVFDEAFLSFAHSHGEEGLYLVRFETDPFRICERIGLDYHGAKPLCRKIERINRALGLNETERASSYYDSTTFQHFVSQARHDWLRGKIKRRAEDRRRREMANAPSEDDLLWRKIR